VRSRLAVQKRMINAVFGRMSNQPWGSAEAMPGMNQAARMRVAMDAVSERQGR
jgi:hypothetical protein